MLKSSGIRFAVVAVLALLMAIPLGLVADIIKSRADYSDSTTTSLSGEWGGAQLLSGPQIVIPVTEDVTYDRKREAIDPTTGLALRDADDKVIFEFYQETITETRPPVFLYPDRFDLALDVKTQERSRGIFAVPVYTSDVQAGFDFRMPQAETTLRDAEILHWDDAELRVYLSANRALRGAARLSVDGTTLDLSPLADGRNGIFARLGDPRELGTFALALGINGAQWLQASAVGRTSSVTMTSDWPDPSFAGDFLPDSSDITDAGFTAHWTVPHLARPLPQVSRSNPDDRARETATMGVRFLTPNDFYQQAYRLAEYGLLFIALTFLSVLLLDRASDRPAHPVQFLMIGLAQAIFVLLMVAYAEQLGFSRAFLGASAATITLIVVYAAVAMDLQRRIYALAAALTALYAVIYLLLQSTDYTLMIGATLAFAALAVTMFLTRSENWDGDGTVHALWQRLFTDPDPRAGQGRAKPQ